MAGKASIESHISVNKVNRSSQLPATGLSLRADFIFSIGSMGTPTAMAILQNLHLEGTLASLSHDVGVHCQASASRPPCSAEMTALFPRECLWRKHHQLSSDRFEREGFSRFQKSNSKYSLTHNPCLFFRESFEVRIVLFSICNILICGHLYRLRMTPHQ